MRKIFKKYSCIGCQCSDCKYSDFKDLVTDILGQLGNILNNKDRLDKTKNGIYGEILGYAPLREEFEVEYDNEAELFLADMEFSPEDSKEEIQIKENILEIYNR